VVRWDVRVEAREPRRDAVAIRSIDREVGDDGDRRQHRPVDRSGRGRPGGARSQLLDDGAGGEHDRDDRQGAREQSPAVAPDPRAYVVVRDLDRRQPVDHVDRV
jgi:hypothetical protein